GAPAVRRPPRREGGHVPAGGIRLQLPGERRATARAASEGGKGGRTAGAGRGGVRADRGPGGGLGAAARRRRGGSTHRDAVPRGFRRCPNAPAGGKQGESLAVAAGASAAEGGSAVAVSARGDPRLLRPLPSRLASGGPGRLGGRGRLDGGAGGVLGGAG